MRSGGHVTIFKPGKNFLGMYFAYFTQAPTFEESKHMYAKGAKVIDVFAKDLSKIQIPIPCLSNPEKSRAITPQSDTMGLTLQVEPKQDSLGNC